MTVGSMGMFASGALSFLACRVTNLVEANSQVSDGVDDGVEWMMEGRG